MENNDESKLNVSELAMVNGGWEHGIVEVHPLKWNRFSDGKVSQIEWDWSATVKLSRWDSFQVGWDGKAEITDRIIKGYDRSRSNSFDSSFIRSIEEAVQKINIKPSLDDVVLNISGKFV